MSGQELGAWVAAATAVAGFLTALIGIPRYFSYRTRRDRIATVGAALDAVVVSLASVSDIHRAAAAIRLRRFFDRRSELGVAGVAYAADALNVIAAVLRELPTSNVQKLLADGLSYAPSLAGADLQRTNLRNAYLAGTDLAAADFFQADVSDGSLKGASARGAKFYRTRLVRCVLSGADLRDTVFFEADLQGSIFSRAQLQGARFTGCTGVPVTVAGALDAGGVFTGSDPVPALDPSEPRRAQFFLSRPFLLSPEQTAVAGQVTATLTRGGAEVVSIERRDASPAGVLADLRQVMSGCAGVVVLGLRQIEVWDGRSRAGTPADTHISGLALATPWNHAEAGLAIGLGLPIFRVHDSGIDDGVFAPDADPQPPLDLATGGLASTLLELETWARLVCNAPSL